MTTAPIVPGGDDQLPGGNSEDQKEVQPDPATPPAKGTVSYETYTKVLDEAKAAKAKVAQFEKSQKEFEEAKLKEAGDWKKIAEQREQELKGAKEIISENERRISEGRKLNALLGAMTGEVPKQYWSLMDLDDVTINPETGLPDDASVKVAAERFEKQFPDVVKKPSKSKLPNDAAKGGTGKITYATWLTLPLEEQRARIADVDKSTL